MTAPAHDGTVFAGQTLEWLGTDTLASWQRYMQDPEHRDYFQQQGWDRSDAISYRINTDGFRGEEFGTGEYLLALGCSYTLGIGLPESAVWPYKVSKSLKLQVANVSWGGYAADTCFRLASYWIHALGPRVVMFLLPPEARIELILGGKLNNRTTFDVFMPHNMIDSDTFLRHWITNPENAKLNRERNALAVQMLCSRLHIPCVVQPCDAVMNQPTELVQFARDHMHGGPKGQDMIANNFLKEYHERYC
jgi:hypothetical protein